MRFAVFARVSGREGEAGERDLPAIAGSIEHAFRLSNAHNVQPCCDRRHNRALADHVLIAHYPPRCFRYAGAAVLP